MTYSLLIIKIDRCFNAAEFDISVENFFYIYSFKNLIKESACFKNPCNPKCIDFMMANRSSSSQNSRSIETGLSDFNKMAAFVLRFHFPKLGSRHEMQRLK